MVISGLLEGLATGKDVSSTVVVVSGGQSVMIVLLQWTLRSHVDSLDSVYPVSYCHITAVLSACFVIIIVQVLLFSAVLPMDKGPVI